MKYLAYPSLQRITFDCPDCSATVAVFSHYAQACTVRAAHRCVQVVPTGRLGQTKTTVRFQELVRR